MPYFHTPNVNLLFIHIPKTGGTSLESYFSSKYAVELNQESLVGFSSHLNLDSSLQHLTLSQILEHAGDFKIDLNQLRIITVVRNPYERTISDLFWFDLIDENMSADEVYPILRDFVTSNGFDFDMHPRPQHEYLKLKKQSFAIQILHTESLNSDMHHFGYEDFNVHISKNKSNRDYYSLLNQDSIQLINNVYRLDFEKFRYKMLLERPMKPTGIKLPVKPIEYKKRTEVFLTPEAFYMHQTIHKQDRLLQKRQVKKKMPKQSAMILAGK